MRSTRGKIESAASGSQVLIIAKFSVYQMEKLVISWEISRMKKGPTVRNNFLFPFL